MQVFKSEAFEDGKHLHIEIEPKEGQGDNLGSVEMLVKPLDRNGSFLRGADIPAEMRALAERILPATATKPSSTRGAPGIDDFPGGASFRAADPAQLEAEIVGRLKEVDGLEYKDQKALQIDRSKVEIGSAFARNHLDKETQRLVLGQMLHDLDDLAGMGEGNGQVLRAAAAH